MRIVIKPVGIVLILAAIATLVFLAIRRNGETGANASLTAADTAATGKPAGGDPAGAAEKAADAMKPTGASILRAGDFEGTFDAINVMGKTKATTAKIGGKSAAPWSDNSGWASVVLDYAKETSNPHSGKTCQKIEVHDIGPGGQAQFVQLVDLKPGATYKATVWARAAAPTTVEMALRQLAEPRVCWQKQYKTVGTSWEQLSFTAKIGDDGKGSFMIIEQHPNTTIWVDDATLTEVS